MMRKIHPRCAVTALAVVLLVAGAAVMTGCHRRGAKNAAVTPPPKPLTWVIRAEGQKRFEALKEHPEVTPGTPLLSVRLNISYVPAEGDAKLLSDQIRLETSQHEVAKLFALGAGDNEMDQFNIYGFESNASFPKMDYFVHPKDKAPAFGLRANAPKSPATIVFPTKTQTILLGFLLPKTQGPFRLHFGASNEIELVP